MPIERDELFPWTLVQQQNDESPPAADAFVNDAEPLPEPELPEDKPEFVPADIPRVQSVADLRRFAFARRLCETLNVGEAYRDVYDPGAEVQTYHNARGSAMLQLDGVRKIVQSIALPVLVELGVDKNHIIKRLIETAESDITDYLDATPSDGEEVTGKIMSGEKLRALPFHKRRLIKKYKEKYHAITGALLSREIELESKGDAMKLLAAVQQWVKPGDTTIVNNETIVTVMNFAQKNAAQRAAAAREAAKGSNSARQITRPAIEGRAVEVKTLPPPAAPPPVVVSADAPAARPPSPAYRKPVDKLEGFRAPTENSGVMEGD